ncbi:leucine-rich repeat domain-containing protein [Leucobacter chromiireducens]|uniref:leucine-rich repeat domain-containing protein n=1 Tax=Leucobacter chromiireducens TaxID=283877 RepID=UPI003F7EDB03
MGLRRMDFGWTPPQTLRRGTAMLIGALVVGGVFATGAMAPAAAQALPTDIIDIPLGSDTGLGATTPSEASVDHRPAQPLEPRQTRALPDDREPAEIPDPVLRREIARKLNISSPQSLTKGDLRRLQSLTAKNVGITDLTGLEIATNLSLLYVDQNNITSFEPLRGLSNMRQITASRNPISDISPLATLPNLNWLELNWTEITSLEALRGNTKLGWLQVAYTGIDSIEPLSESTNIGSLYFQNTSVSDISALSGIDNIQVISAPDAEISDLEPLRGKQKLYLLNINSNHVTDLSMLETWPEISTVGFNNQKVDGGKALIPTGASEFTRSDIVPMFKMPFGERQQVVEHAAPTEDGDGAVWSDIEADADRIEVFLSKPVVPGGPPFSATVDFAVGRADFESSAPGEGEVGTPYEFAFSTTPGFTDTELTRATSAAGYRLTSGEVPGLQLSEAGVLAGTPTEQGDFALTVRATDRHGNFLESDVTVAVGKGAVRPQPPIVEPPTVTPPTVTPPTTVPPTTQPPTTAPVAPGTTATTTEKLAATGAALPWALGSLALLLCAAGAYLVLRSRRRRAGE